MPCIGLGKLVLFYRGHVRLSPHPGPSTVHAKERLPNGVPKHRERPREGAERIPLSRVCSWRGARHVQGPFIRLQVLLELGPGSAVRR